MLCANPNCRHESHYLRDGSLYCVDDAEVEGGHQHRRFIWLCKTCAPKFHVETWRPAGEQLRPSAERRVAVAQQPESELLYATHLPEAVSVAPHTGPAKVTTSGTTRIA